MSLTKKEVIELAELLKKLEPGFLPYQVFEQVARIVALPVVEFIPLRQSPDGSVEVLLIDRGPADPLWPNMLHTPGTIVRADDLHKGLSHGWQAFERIMRDELKDTKVGEPQYFGSIFHDSKRGSEQAQLYWIEVIGEPRVGRFYDVDELPGSLIDSQSAFIAQAAKDFAAKKSSL